MVMVSSSLTTCPLTMVWVENVPTSGGSPGRAGPSRSGGRVSVPGQLAEAQIPPRQTRPAEQSALAQHSWQAVPHSFWPLGQFAITQLPFWQVLPPVQATPQLPQLALSVLRFLHSPPQLVWPAGQPVEAWHVLAE